MAIKTEARASIKDAGWADGRGRARAEWRVGSGRVTLHVIARRVGSGRDVHRGTGVIQSGYEVSATVA
jgi:hypothetical protein